jgi:hypothetical protein
VADNGEDRNDDISGRLFVPPDDSVGLIVTTYIQVHNYLMFLERWFEVKRWVHNILSD